MRRVSPCKHSGERVLHYSAHQQARLGDDLKKVYLQQPLVPLTPAHPRKRSVEDGTMAA